MLIKRIEIKKSKFCTGASIVICIAMSSVKKTLKPKTIREPPIIKKPALTREIIIQTYNGDFRLGKIKRGIRRVGGDQARFWSAPADRSPFRFRLFSGCIRSCFNTEPIVPSISLGSSAKKGEPHLFTSS